MVSCCNIHQRMSTIFYRKYNCSIEAPNFKGLSFRGNKFESSSGLTLFQAGTDSANTTTHLITPQLLPILDYKTYCGTLDFYITTTTGNKNHVAMSCVNKTLTTNTITVYQTVGDVTGLVISFVSPNYRVVTTDSTVLQWKFSGVGLL